MLIVVGSRRDGNSLKLANVIKNELEKDRVSVSVLVPGNMRIHLCTGCMDCDKNGVCDFTDDMESAIEKIKKENIIMFITPTRWNLLSGDLKIFMDRLNPMYATNGLKGKIGIAVSIGAKAKDVYSSYAACGSLRGFMESAAMKCVLEKDFNNCKDAGDILLKDKEVDEFLEKVKNVVKEN